MPSNGKTLKHLLLPEFIEPKAGAWTIRRVDIGQSSVDTTNRVANVPEAHTPAQRLARLHELGHVKYSPSPNQPMGDWERVVRDVTNAVLDKGITPLPGAVLKISKMLEENRIDWLLWDRHGIDLRPAREVLDWSLIPDPSDKLQALGDCLQLAWTVWASRGLGKGIPNMPPARTPDAETGEFFDKAWKFLCDEDRELAMTMIKGCFAMYRHPTDTRRNAVAAELAAFFPVPEPEEEPERTPPQKETETAAEKEIEKQQEIFEQEKDKQETGVGSEVQRIKGVEYHDHTATVRRPSMRIARRRTPVAQGIETRYAHRYMMDKAIFSQRLLTEGGLMIDGSGSMQWTEADMQEIMKVLPAIWVGIYSGFGYSYGSMTGRYTEGRVYARICTIAKQGRFARFDGLDAGHTDGNDADLEGLQLLATWPKPRLWLSDGMVCGGVHDGKPEHHEAVGYFQGNGRLHELCSAWMKRHDILRVPDKETLFKLLKRQRVTLYRTPRPSDDHPTYGNGAYNLGIKLWPDTYKPEPVQFQL